NRLSAADCGSEGGFWTAGGGIGFDARIRWNATFGPNSWTTKSLGNDIDYATNESRAGAEAGFGQSVSRWRSCGRSTQSDCRYIEKRTYCRSKSYSGCLSVRQIAGF